MSKKWKTNLILQICLLFFHVNFDIGWFLIVTALTMTTIYISLLLQILKYCKRKNTSPFIDLNCEDERPPVYEENFTISNDGVPICQAGFACTVTVKNAIGRNKFRCPKINHNGRCVSHT